MKALRRGEKAPQCRHDTSGSRFGFKKVLRAIRIWSNRIENSWLGDLIGCACLFGSLWLGLVLAHAMTGGAQ